MTDPVIEISDQYGGQPPAYYRLSQMEGLTQGERAKLASGLTVESGGGAQPIMILKPMNARLWVC